MAPSNESPEQEIVVRGNIELPNFAQWLQPRNLQDSGRPQHSVEVKPHTPGRGLGFLSRVPTAGNEGVIIQSGSLVQILEGKRKGSIGVVQSVLEVKLNRLVVEFPRGTVSVNQDMVTMESNEE